MSTSMRAVEDRLKQRYDAGFVTDIPTDVMPPGLNEDVIRAISAKKEEPEWLTEWRLAAYRRWLTMTPPDWAKLSIEPIDYQSIRYFAAPKGPKYRSLDEVPKELLDTYDRLGVPLHERAKLAGVAVDAVFDSVSVGTTFRAELAKAGVIFCSFSEAVREYPELVRQYLGSVVPPGDNYFAALNSAVFSDGSFVYIPKGTRCPMELSTYFRINAAETGQFERTLIVAEAGAYVSYLEGCTAPMRDENQLHAAVVELIALDDAEIKYSTVQNWYPGDENGVGGIYNFVTKRGDCRGVLEDQLDTGRDRLGDHLEVPELRADRRRLGRRVPLGGVDESPPAGRHRDQDDPHRQAHQIEDHLQGHLGRARPADLSRAGPRREGCRGRAQLHPVRLVADRQALRCPHLPLHRGEEPDRDGRARSHHLEDLRRPAVLLPVARYRRGGRGVDDRRWFLPPGVPRAPHGVRGRG
jgi:hypothetical protein